MLLRVYDISIALIIHYYANATYAIFNVNWTENCMRRISHGISMMNVTL